MTAIGDALARLRAAVEAGAAASGSGIRGAVSGGAFEAPEIASVPGGTALDHVSVRPVDRLTIADLEAELGPATRLPARPTPGAPRTFLFPGTFPAEGATGATVLAEADPDGLVSRVIVRRDVL
jgi:hypothetical protein